MERTICIFGDSITFGAFDAEGGGWANRLKNHFWKEEKDVETYNLGVSGDNTNDLLERFYSENEQREPGLIIVAIGINDSQYIGSGDNPRVSSEKFRANLLEIISQAHQFTKDVIFVGLTEVDESKTAPIPWKEDTYYDNKNIEKYNSIIKEMCEEKGILFADMSDLLGNSELYDGLHPDSKGHEKMFERIKNFIVEKKLV